MGVGGRLARTGCLFTDHLSENEQDKRNVDVELTELGKKAAIEAMQNRQAYADELFAAMPQRKKQQLAGLLDSLLHTWDIPINEEEYQFYDSEE